MEEITSVDFQLYRRSQPADGELSYTGPIEERAVQGQRNLAIHHEDACWSNGMESSFYVLQGDAQPIL
ncbi:MAG: hypothetical protein U5O69_04035 [Candidatus Competibacteraceae bacterium]|nr:hypothetical protein [Candidatus Competibacteraceae bacterium]